MKNINQPSIAMSDTEEVKCSCGSSLFKQAVSIRKVSAMLTKTGREEYVPIAALLCIKCDKVFEPNRLVS